MTVSVYPPWMVALVLKLMSQEFYETEDDQLKESKAPVLIPFMFK